MKKSYKGIGVMSGTSLDGIDIVSCEFFYKNNSWSYCFQKGITYDYSSNLYERLLNSQNITAYELAKLNNDYGKEIGMKVKQFLIDTKFKPDFIASHGYTVFHNPNDRLTLQIGSGAEIAALTEITTVCDFRTIDIALGGNGAPLVPIGDKLLFGEFDACLNLGGFSNISYDKNGERLASDICPVNILLNHLSNKLGSEYDDGGRIGRSGNVNQKLLNKLNELNFYYKEGPKSLGREFLTNDVFPLLNNEISVEDLLRTSYEHISDKISQVINNRDVNSVLVTGGGAHNSFLIELIKSKTKKDLIIPDAHIVNFKEAIIFAFLGVLRLINKPNCLKSATGSSSNNIGGAIYY